MVEMKVQVRTYVHKYVRMSACECKSMVAGAQVLGLVDRWKHPSSLSAGGRGLVACVHITTPGTASGRGVGHRGGMGGGVA